MNPLSPEGLAKSREKTKAYADARNNVTPELLAGAQSVFDRYGTSSYAGHYGTATVRTPEELMAERCASIMALESYEHSLDLEAARRRANRWYRRLYRWVSVWVWFIFNGPQWGPVISGNRWVARWYR